MFPFSVLILNSCFFLTLALNLPRLLYSPKPSLYPFKLSQTQYFVFTVVKKESTLYWSLYSYPRHCVIDDLTECRGSHLTSLFFKFFWLISLPSQVPSITGSRGAGCTDLWQDPQQYQQENQVTTGRAGHILPGCQAEQSHHTIQTRLGGPGVGGDGQHSLPPAPLSRDCSRGRGFSLSSQEPGTMTRVSATQESRLTDQGKWSVKCSLPEA